MSAVPDMATVSLGVTTIATSAAGALAANSAAIAAVTRRLDAMKVPAQDIRTSGLSLRPNYAARTESQPAQITGYTASNTLTITLNQIDKTGAILDAAVRDGANRLESLSFGLANPAPQQTRARKAAVADARSPGADPRRGRRRQAWPDHLDHRGRSRPAPGHGPPRGSGHARSDLDRHARRQRKRDRRLEP